MSRYAPLTLFCCLLLLALVLTVHHLLPLLHDDGNGHLLLHYSFLPRLTISLLAGGALALAGLLFQQVLRNPLAEPATLGVAAGANLAIALALVLAPGLLVWGMAPVALAGAGITTLLLLLLVAKQQLATLNILLAGMVLSLYASAISTLLVMFNHDYLSDLFSWQAGALSQNGWDSVRLLLLPLLLLSGGSLLLARPLTLLGLSEQSAASLGASPLIVRLLTLLIAVALSALVTSQLGIISFIGLAAPALVRLLGVRRFSQQLPWTLAFGAVLLWLIDQLAQSLSPAAGDVPTGAIAALFSAPLILLLLSRQRTIRFPQAASDVPAFAPALGGRKIALLLCLLLLAIGLSLGWNRQFTEGMLLAWRWPRLLGSLAAGAMLAVAGVLIQRLTRNPLASPELLGISSGASLAILLLFMLAGPLSWMLPAALLGSLLATGAMLWLGARRGFQPQRLVLVGLCLTSISSALTSLLMLSGDPRALQLLNWSTGSTAGITGSAALFGAGQALVLIPLALLLRRGLQLLGLGVQPAQSLGLHLRANSLLILLLAAALTAGGTLLIGPLSFIGLIAPQLARYSGARSVSAQIGMAALLGATLMVLADWLGRNIAWPWPVSAGILCSLIGAPWFLWQLRRR
ncbi:Fe(3+)-hydroxamate ABC transporter permease FhuB [Pseudomonas graminis]